MNQKNSLGLNSCFLDVDDPFQLFYEWMEEAKKTEPYDPNAVSLATSNQRQKLENRDELINSIKEYKNKYSDETKVPRPKHWSGWNLSPLSIEFWLDGENMIHERLKYTKEINGKWIKTLLSP